MTLHTHAVRVLSKIPKSGPCDLETIQKSFKLLFPKAAIRKYLKELKDAKKVAFDEDFTNIKNLVVSNRKPDDKPYQYTLSTLKGRLDITIANAIRAHEPCLFLERAIVMLNSCDKLEPGTRRMVGNTHKLIAQEGSHLSGTAITKAYEIATELMKYWLPVINLRELNRFRSKQRVLEFTVYYKDKNQRHHVSKAQAINSALAIVAVRQRCTNGFFLEKVE